MRAKSVPPRLISLRCQRPADRAAAAHVARAEDEVRVAHQRREEPRQVRRVVAEVGVHLDHRPRLGALEHPAEPVAVGDAQSLLARRGAGPRRAARARRSCRPAPRCRPASCRRRRAAMPPAARPGWPPRSARGSRARCRSAARPTRRDRRPGRRDGVAGRLVSARCRHTRSRRARTARGRARCARRRTARGPGGWPGPETDTPRAPPAGWRPAPGCPSRGRTARSRAAEVLGVEVGVVAVDARAGGEQLVAQAEGGAEGVLADVAAVGDAEHEHRLAVERADPVLDRVDREARPSPR